MLLRLLLLLLSLLVCVSAIIPTYSHSSLQTDRSTKASMHWPRMQTIMLTTKPTTRTTMIAVVKRRQAVPQVFELHRHLGGQHQLWWSWFKGDGVYIQLTLHSTCVPVHGCPSSVYIITQSTDGYTAHPVPVRGCPSGIYNTEYRVPVYI